MYVSFVPMSMTCESLYIYAAQKGEKVKVQSI